MRYLWSLLAGIALILAACGPTRPGLEATPTLDRHAVDTAVAGTQTEAAQLTALATALTPAATSGLLPVSRPTNTPLYLTRTPALSWTPLPSPTTFALSTRGDKATYVADITIPDGTRMEPGKSFTKIWRLMNSGDTTWSTGYTLVFVSGSQMGGPASIPIPTEVPLGKTVDLTVRLTAPQENGSFRGFWMLRNDRGEYFGIGPGADKAIWVDIFIGPGVGTPGVIVTFLQASAQISTGKGGCPALYQLVMNITISQAAKVRYQWEGYSEGLGGKLAPFAVHEVELTEAGSFMVGPENFKVAATSVGQLRVHVIAPEDVISPPIEFSADCEDE